MKKRTVVLTGLVAVALLMETAVAQPPVGNENRPGQGFRRGTGFGPGQGRGPGPERGFRPPTPPLMLALDADKDGELSSDEIKNAATALKTLDKDEDGKLSREELRPQFARPGDGDAFRGPGSGGEGRPGDFRRPQPGGRGPGGGGEEGGPARAGAGSRGGNFVDRIMGCDSNKDGKVSKDEMPEPMQRLLERVDTNEDGAIDRKEAEAMVERFRARQGGPARGAAPGGRAGGEGERPERPRPPQRPE